MPAEPGNGMRIDGIACVAGDRVRSVMAAFIRRRSRLTADLASAMRWSSEQRSVSANKPSRQEAGPANRNTPPAPEGAFNLPDSGFGRDALVNPKPFARIARSLPPRKMINEICPIFYQLNALIAVGQALVGTVNGVLVRMPECCFDNIRIIAA